MGGGCVEVGIGGGEGVGCGTVEVGSVALEGWAGVGYGTVEVGSVTLEGEAGVGAGVEVGVGVSWVSGSGGMMSGVRSRAVSSGVLIRSHSRRRSRRLARIFCLTILRLMVARLLVAIVVVILWFAGWDLMKNQGICFGTNL